jgi:hypothetical protein
LRMLFVLDNLIRTIPNALGLEQCDYLIDMYESYPALQELQDNGQGQSLTRMNLMASNYTPFKEDLEYLTGIFKAGVAQYKDMVGLSDFQFPFQFEMEAMKIKKYDVKDQSFPPHIDVMNLEMSRRFLVMFIYLTDNKAGETIVQDVRSPCTKGTMILFPPMWPWVHSGEAPVEVPKYILGSYLQYV